MLFQRTNIKQTDADILQDTAKQTQLQNSVIKHFLFISEGVKPKYKE